MDEYIQKSEQNNNFMTYKNEKQREPDPQNKYNQDYLYGGPSGLKRDYDALYRSLEYETVQRLSRMERGQEPYIREAEFLKGENIRYQQQFDKALVDNKALFLRCKELEAKVVHQNNPQNEYSNNNNQYNRDYQSSAQAGSSQYYQGQQSTVYDAGTTATSQNRMLQLQSEIDDLKRDNYDLKNKLQAEIQDKNIPYSRSLITSPPSSRVVSSAYNSVPQAIQSHGNYCDQVISSNEHHNRIVLERCKSIVASHNYY